MSVLRINKASSFGGYFVKEVVALLEKSSYTKTSNTTKGKAAYNGTWCDVH